MGRFRTNVTVFGLALITSVLLLEFSGWRESVGISWRWSVIGSIPAWVAVPLLFFVGAIWYLDPA